MDHYKVLGLARNASKEEIKNAFRKLAVKFHPDKHSQSPKDVRDNATLRFRQISEAYQILGDDRKRADYNIKSSSSSPFTHRNRTTSNSYHYYYGNHSHSGYGNSYSYSGGGGGLPSKLDIMFRYFMTRSFLLHVVFAGALFGGMAFIEASGDTLWKMHNSGRSFEEAMDSIEKAKLDRDKV